MDKDLSQEYQFKNFYFFTGCDFSNDFSLFSWSCCSSANKCEENQGDCDEDTDCKDGLICGINNCKDIHGLNFPEDSADCCISEGNKNQIHH